MTTAYGSTDGYKAWASARGVTVSALDGAIDAARLRASEYIDAAYRNQFPGWRVAARNQDREWPRYAALDREGMPIDPATVPGEVANATYEGTTREIASPGALNPDIKPGGGVVKRVKAGSVEVEYESNNQLTKTFQAIEQALGPILTVRASYSGVSARA